MKILLITSFFPPTHTAGTEKRTLGYALRLQELGYQVQVVCAGTFDEGDHYWNGYVDEVYRQIPVRRVHLNWTLAPDPNRFLYDNPVVEQHLEKWLKQWQPDLVHITSCYTLSASVIRAAKAQHLPVVLTLTDFWFICPKLSLLCGNGSLCDGCTTSEDCLECLLWNTKVYRGLSIMPEKVRIETLKWISRQPRINRIRGLRGMALDMDQRKTFLPAMVDAVDCVTAPSAYLGKLIKAAGMLKPIRVIRSGHDLSWLKTLPDKKPSDQIRIGYISHITPVKGLHVLLSAFISASLTERAQLSIFGSSNGSSRYMQQLQNIISEQKSAITFYGAFPHEDLGKVLSEIDVLVVPSQWHENNPRVIQEAFASKTPVVASNVGGISEFVQHEVNGMLFERSNIDDLAHQLQRVATEPGLLERLKSGIPPVKQIGEEVAELIEIYRGLTTQNSSSDNNRKNEKQ